MATCKFYYSKQLYTMANIYFHTQNIFICAIIRATAKTLSWHKYSKLLQKINEVSIQNISRKFPVLPKKTNFL